MRNTQQILQQEKVTIQAVCSTDSPIHFQTDTSTKSISYVFTQQYWSSANTTHMNTLVTPRTWECREISQRLLQYRLHIARLYHQVVAAAEHALDAQKDVIVVDGPRRVAQVKRLCNTSEVCLCNINLYDK